MPSPGASTPLSRCSWPKPGMKGGQRKLLQRQLLLQPSSRGHPTKRKFRKSVPWSLSPSFQSPAFASIPWTPYESEDQQPSRCRGHEVSPRVHSTLEGRMQVGGRMEEIRHNTQKRCHTPNNLVSVHISVSCLKVQWHEIAKETVMILMTLYFISEKASEYWNKGRLQSDHTNRHVVDRWVLESYLAQLLSPTSASEPSQWNLCSVVHRLLGTDGSS